MERLCVFMGEGGTTDLPSTDRRSEGFPDRGLGLPSDNATLPSNPHLCLEAASAVCGHRTERSRLASALEGPPTLAFGHRAAASEASTHRNTVGACAPHVGHLGLLESAKATSQ